MARSHCPPPDLFGKHRGCDRPRSSYHSTQLPSRWVIGKGMRGRSSFHQQKTGLRGLETLPEGWQDSLQGLRRRPAPLTRRRPGSSRLASARPTRDGDQPSLDPEPVYRRRTPAPPVYTLLQESPLLRTTKRLAQVRTRAPSIRKLEQASIRSGIPECLYMLRTSRLVSMVSTSARPGNTPGWTISPAPGGRWAAFSTLPPTPRGVAIVRYRRSYVFRRGYADIAELRKVPIRSRAHGA